MVQPTLIKIDRKINDEKRDFFYLFGIYKKLKDISNSEVRFDFYGCKFLRQNAVAFLGALTRLLINQQNKVGFNLDSIDNDVKANLYKNGFLRTLNLDPTIMSAGNTMPYREDRIFDSKDYISYLKEKWLGQNRLDLDNAEKSLVISRVIEVYNNVFEHAQSPIGVITCGQYYPQKHELRLTLVDLGIGIPYKVRNHFKKPDMRASQTLKWVFEHQNTTKTFYGGNGLKLLKSFITDYHGKLEIYSDKGYACIQGGKTEDIFEDHQIGFNGTLIQISISADSNSYSNIPPDFDSSEIFF